MEAFWAQCPAVPILVVTTCGCALSMLAAFLSVHLHLAGFSARAIGFNAAAAGVAALAVAPFIPWAAVRLGTAPLLLCSLAMSVASLAGFALTRGFTAWFVLRAIEGGCATVLFALSEYWITRRPAPDWRGPVIGAYVGCVALGFALGPALLMLPGVTGDRPLFLAMGLFAGAAVLLCLRFRDAPAVERRQRLGLLHCFRVAPAVLLAALLHGAIETSGLNLLPVFAASAGADLARGTLFASLFILGNGLLQLPIGVLAGRFDRSRMLAALAALAACGAVLLALTGATRLPFAGGLLLWGGIVGSFYPVGLGELPRRFAQADLMAANSAYVMAYALGTLLGPPIVGEGLDLAPPSGFFYAMAGLCGAYLVATRLVAIRYGRHQGDLVRRAAP